LLIAGECNHKCNHCGCATPGRPSPAGAQIRLLSTEDGVCARRVCRDRDRCRDGDHQHV